MQPAGDRTTPLTGSETTYVSFTPRVTRVTSDAAQCTATTLTPIPTHSPKGVLEMQPQPKPALAPGNTMRTLCPNCCGTGHIASDRATQSDNPGVHGAFQMRACPTCEGQRWLAGLQPPV
jgi:hypothetical protein